MIDPRRKRLYIIVISVAILLAAAMLIWTKIYSPNTDIVIPTTTTNKSPGALNTVTGNATTGYSTPTVFPANSSFDFSALKSLEKFNPYQPVSIDPNTLGRENPFSNY